VAEYIKTFSSAFGGAAPQPITVGKKVKADAESLKRGAQLYQNVQCFKCHGAAGRGDGPSALTLTDDYAHVIYPADLTQAWLFRGGGTADDIYMRIMTGMTGSPMPSFADALVTENGNPDEQKRWDLANYVDSLSPDTAPEPQAAIIVKPIAGNIPSNRNAPEWQNATLYYYSLVGQIMREPRNFTPSIKGVWVRALYNASEVALLVQWDDRQQNTGANGEPADEIAVQFPAAVPEGAERPYFVYGDANHPVNLWTWTAGAQAPVEQTARGLDSITPQAKQDLTGSAEYAEGRYSVIFHRALNTGDAEDIPLTTGVFIPIAFTASDGLRNEKAGSGAISSWYQIYFDQPVPATRYIWIPLAVIAAALAEGWLVWLVRRRQTKVGQ
jgi:DMSO reductase family type II enzyme heme b subunit